MTNDNTPRRHARILFAALFLLISAGTVPSARAANVCAGTGIFAQRGGIGGTGIQPGNAPGGIGGTGIEPGLRPGGVGGTGINPEHGGGGGTGVSADEGGIGGTGIYGTVTAFGSICVNGVEIHYNKNTPVEYNGKSSTVNTLALGQVVAVDTFREGNAVRARHINIRDLVTGPVEKVNPARGVIRILGQSVHIARFTHIGNRGVGPRAARRIKPGSYIRVSGLRRAGGTIVATRVAVVPAIPQVQVTGPVTAVTGKTLRVFGLTVATGDAQVTGSVARGRTVTVTGRWGDGRVTASRIAVERELPFAGPVAQVDIEAFIQRVGRRNQIRVGGIPIVLAPNTHVFGGNRADLTAGRPVRIMGVVRQGQVRAERIVIERPELARPETRQKDTETAQPATAGSSAETPDTKTLVTNPTEDVPATAPAASDQAEIPERPDNVGSAQETTKPQIPDRPDITDRPETPDRPTVPDRPAVPDRPSVPERPVVPERPQIPETPSVPERPSVPQPPERPEVPETQD